MPRSGKKTHVRRRKQSRRSRTRGRRMRGRGLPTRRTNLALTRKQATNVADGLTRINEPELYQQLLKVEEEAREALINAGISYDERDPVGEYRRKILGLHD